MSLIEGKASEIGKLTRDPLQEQKVGVWKIFAEMPHHDQVNVGVFVFEKIYTSINASQNQLRKTIDESRMEYQGFEEQKAIFVKFAQRLTEEYGREERFENEH